MMVSPQSVTTTLRWADCPDGDPVPATLYYDPGDPHLVTLTFIVNELDVLERETGRELLAAGLATDADAAAAGWMDAKVWPVGRRVCLHLSSDDGEVTWSLSRLTLATFLDLTYRMVPAGTEWEWLDLDRVVDRLLAGAT